MAEKLLLFSGVLALPCSVLFLLATLALHFLVPRRLRRDLVTERYFNEFELGLEFPASIFHTLAIARAVAIPASMTRRFGSYDFRKTVRSWFLVICRIYLGLTILTGISILVFVFATVLLMIDGKIDV